MRSSWPLLSLIRHIQGAPKLVPELSALIAPGRMALAECFERAKLWIDHCATNHASCEARPIIPLPTRLIDVSAEPVRLVEPGGRMGRYLALSHCWGDSRAPCLTTRTTKKSNMRTIPRETLPATFRDAIDVTRGLGVQFVWIDSICIIQDDDDDWRREAAAMAAVYQGAYLTICATAASNDDKGLFLGSPCGVATKITVVHKGAPWAVHFRDNLYNRAVHVSVAPWRVGTRRGPMLEVSPLCSRGWTMQEMALSPRLLHFSHGEMLWQCPERHTCDCCANTPVSSKCMREAKFLAGWARRAPLGKYKDTNLWRQLVERYTTLHAERG